MASDFCFSDWRGKDLSDLDLSGLTLEDLLTCSFDQQTIWPKHLPQSFDPAAVLEEGKNPGLGLRDLHREGFDGRGIHVAIIDQKLRPDHEEYAHALVAHHKIGLDAKEEFPMHGPAVAGILVGKTCGVAPGAALHYYGTPSISRRIETRTKALNDILDYNQSVPFEDRIRVVSCSFALESGEPRRADPRWLQAKQRAMDSDVLVLDVTMSQIKIRAVGSDRNRDDPESYRDWLLFSREAGSKEVERSRCRLSVPVDHRSLAASEGREAYWHQGNGGMSWGIPYLAGACALALQINPQLHASEIGPIIEQSATVRADGIRLINPRGAIELARPGLDVSL